MFSNPVETHQKPARNEIMPYSKVEKQVDISESGSSVPPPLARFVTSPTVSK